MLVSQYTPNRIVKHAVPGDTAWRIVASDGTTYTTYALLVAAGKVPYPGLDAGGHLEWMTLRSETGAGADGDPFYYHIGGVATISNDNDGFLVSGAGQIVNIPGPIKTVWIRATTGTDEIILEGAY